MQSLLGIGLLLLGAVVSFMTARYWQLQTATLKEAERLAVEHKLLVDRVVVLERDHALLAQRWDLSQKKCR